MYFIFINAFATASSNQNVYDVIIVGAGVAGLSSAVELQQKGYSILVLESRDRIGGRVWSINPWGSALDLGASWIHGIDDNPIGNLVKKNKIKTLATRYSSDNWQFKINDMKLFDEKGDQITKKELNPIIILADKFIRLINSNLSNTPISMQQRLNRFVLEHRIQGRQRDIFNYIITTSYVYEFAADLSELSLDIQKSFKKSAAKGAQVIFPQGYIQLIGLLTPDIPIKLNEVVKRINYTNTVINVETHKNHYKCRKLIITVPVSVLSSNQIEFIPALPKEKLIAIRQIKMGTFNKIYLHFEKIFWDKQIEWIGLIQHQPEKYPTLDIMNYYKFTKQPILLIFTAGQQAEQLEQLSDQDVVAVIMEELRIIYGHDIPAPSSYRITRWHNDPYAMGSYSYLPKGVSMDVYHRLANSIDNKLFFAGEATSADDHSTVHGAYLSGKRAAQEIIKSEINVLH